jgi:hypothetical protein
VIRPVIAAVLLASALALLKVSTPVIIAGAAAGLLVMVVLRPRPVAPPTPTQAPELDPAVR